MRKVLKIAKEPISLETPIGDEEDSHLGDFIEDKNVVLPIDAAIQSNLRETTTRVLASLTPREERVLRMRFGIGMNTDTPSRRSAAILGHPRAHPPDRGQGPAQAQAPEPVAQAAQLPRQLTRTSPAETTLRRGIASAGRRLDDERHRAAHERQHQQQRREADEPGRPQARDQWPRNPDAARG